MRFLFWVCAALFVVSATMSTNLWRELRAEREQTAALRSEVTEAASREIQIAQAPPPAPAPLPEATASVEPVPAPVAKPALPPAVTFDSRTRDYAAEQRELWKDPEYRKARLEQSRAQIGRNYPGLAEELGLSAADESRLLDLMAESDLNMTAAISGLSAANDPAASQQINNALSDIQRRREEDVVALLGSNGSARWQQYQQNSSARSQANSMNTMLTQAGQPLNAAQLKSLTATMVTEQQRQRDEMTALTRNVNVQDPVARAQLEPELRKRQAEYNERLLAAAASVLSPQQMELMRAQTEQQNAMSNALMRARERATAEQAQGAQ